MLAKIHSHTQNDLLLLSSQRELCESADINLRLASKCECHRSSISPHASEARALRSVRQLSDRTSQRYKPALSHESSTVKHFPPPCHFDRHSPFSFAASWNIKVFTLIDATFLSHTRTHTVMQSHSLISIIFSPLRSQALCNLWSVCCFFPAPLGPDITQTLLWFCGQSQLIVQTVVAERDYFRPTHLTHASLSSRIVRESAELLQKFSTQEKQLVLQFIRLVVMLYDINKLS